MSAQCGRLDAFMDGELPEDERAAFQDHLATCDACRRELRDLMMLEATVATHATALRRAPAPSLEKERAGRRVSAPTPLIYLAPRRRRFVSVSVSLVGVALAAAAAWLLYARTASPPAPSREAPLLLAMAPTRGFEARFSYAPADHYRPYDTDRAAGATAREAVPLETLAKLEQAKDFHGVGVGLLLEGDRDRAGDFLARAAASPDVDADRAVVALQKGKLEDALNLLDKVLTRNPEHAQALFNRGLVLRELGLLLLASESFHRVAELGEVGWATEARARATTLRAQYDEHLSGWQAVKDAGREMATTGVPPSDDLVRAQPSFLRYYVYEAVRAAPSRERVLSLAPLAEKLDPVDHALGAYVARSATRDFAKRAALAATYAKLVASPTALDEGARDAFFASLRAAGEDDMLFGAIVRTGQGAALAGDLLRIAAASKDPWLVATADGAKAKADEDRGDFAAAEVRLRAALASCALHRIDYLGAKLGLELATMLTRLERTAEARAAADDAMQKSRAHSVDQEYSLTFLFGDIARLGSAFALMRAELGDGILRMPDRCDGAKYAHELIANAEIFALDPKAARRELDLAPLCDAPISLLRADTISNLARMGDAGEYATTFAADVAATRAGRLPSERGYADVALGRFLLERDHDAGIALVKRAIADMAGIAGSDTTAEKVRAYGALTLATDAARLGHGEDALAQLADDERCILLVGIDDERAFAVSRDASGAAAVHFDGARATPELSPEKLVPADVRARLAQCPSVRVFAPPPVHGMAQLLPPTTAWSYGALPRPARGDSRPAPAPAGAHRLVVSDIDPPQSLGLPRLERWANDPGADAPGAIWLRGPQATKARVLAELESASEVELHTHGFVDLAVSDASLLVLATDGDGSYTLTAGDLRGHRLRGRPIVVLGACRAAQIAPYLHQPWSMPLALIEAGARAVFASPSPIRDAEAGPFFDGIMARVRAGTTPAEALAGARADWLVKSPKSWVADVLLFD